MRNDYWSVTGRHVEVGHGVGGAHSLRLQDEWEVASETAWRGKTSRQRDTGLVLKVHVWMENPGLRS